MIVKWNHDMYNECVAVSVTNAMFYGMRLLVPSQAPTPGGPGD